jgi:hypothetical protein
LYCEGSPTEILYSLQTFGIAPNHVPIDNTTGAIKMQSWLKWITMRGAFEAARAIGVGPNGTGVFCGVERPTHEDVLLGRGVPINIHRGNVAMREAVLARLERFSNSSDTKEKAAILWEVVLETHKAGGRFLKEEPGKNGWWVEVDGEAAKVKVAVHFRDLKSHTKKAMPRRPGAASAPRLSEAPVTSSMGSLSLGRRKSESAGLLPSTIALDAAAQNHENVTKAPLFSGGLQELDSSTYAFVRGQKRIRSSTNDSYEPCSPDGGCFF